MLSFVVLPVLVVDDWGGGMPSMRSPETSIADADNGVRYSVVDAIRVFSIFLLVEIGDESDGGGNIDDGDDDGDGGNDDPVISTAADDSR